METKLYEFTGLAVTNKLTMQDGSICIDGMIGESAFEVINYAHELILEENITYKVVIYKIEKDINENT